MTNALQVTKFVGKLRDLTDCLTNRKDLVIHQRINQFYYMQKIAELEELSAQLQDTHQRFTFLSEQLDREYLQVFHQWRKDVRWLQTQPCAPHGL